MRALVVFESLYGHTRTIAGSVAAGLSSALEAEVVHVGAASRDLVARADLLVVGGPTHAHGLTSPMSREGALEPSAGSGLEVDPDAGGIGVREWLEALGPVAGRRAAAFDTRVHGPVLLTGHAAKGIATRLEEHGYVIVADPESFLVDRHTVLLPGEVERARDWGIRLAAGVAVPS